MTWQQIEARIKRLEALTTGLVKECSIMERDPFPLHYSERREYLDALHGAIRGLETARVSLVKAKHRKEREAAAKK